MNFFNFPAEIRLQIYEELFVLPEPIRFRTNLGSWDDSRPTHTLLLNKRYGLCPALLRGSKSVNREASPLLYSSNLFEFNEFDPTLVALFFTKIGHQNASFIRQIFIDFPAFDNYKPGSVALHNDSIEMLEIIRDNCTGITKLETLLRGYYPGYPLEIDNSPIVAEATLKLVDTYFKEISSLKEVIVHIHNYQDPSDDLVKKMHDFGWTTKVTKRDSTCCVC
jgi:hypothetical protein